ncbi:MAG: hypothetical protein K0R20_2618 [Actinomycetia bacterium]|jgi:hypothetical protein|nr:hypothetical protein [Actinomycetes bacterium]
MFGSHLAPLGPAALAELRRILKAPQSEPIGFGDVNDIGQRIVAALGEPAARELLEVLERPDTDRAALIGGCTCGTTPGGWRSS